jgi:PAS domain S-box-containing protein
VPWLVALVAGVGCALILAQYWRLRKLQHEGQLALASAGLMISRIRQAVEGASDAIGIGDFEGNSLYHNRAHMQMFGYTVDELNAVPGEGVLFADPQIAQEILVSIRAGRSWTGETDIVAKDGRHIPALVRADIIRDDQGRPVGIFGVFTDITKERQRAEEEARRSTLESLGMMAGSIAHDFRNLLGAMLANVSLAQYDATLSPSIKGRLEGIERAVWRAKEVTEQLTNFARGGTPMLKRVALRAVLVEAAGFAVQNTPVKLVCEVEPDLWEVEADEAQLVQVFNNLAVNAVQAMPGGGQLVVRAQNEPVEPPIPGLPSRYWIAITVADTGVGIPPEHMAKIFEPFFTTKPKGTGLGLATAYAVIGKHGGHLKVDSVLNQGTTFHIRLPALPAAA